MQDSQKDSKTDLTKGNDSPIIGQFNEKSWLTFRVEIPYEDKEKWDEVRRMVIQETSLPLEFIRKDHAIKFAYRVESETSSPWVGIPLRDITKE